MSHDPATPAGPATPASQEGDPTPADRPSSGSSRGHRVGRRPRSPWVRLVAIVLGYAVMAVVAGLVWETIWTPPHQSVNGHVLYYADYASLRRVFSGTGLYTLVGAAASAVTALVAALATRRGELVTLLGVVVGSVVAALVMWQVGVQLGPADPQPIAAHAADGTPLPGMLHLSGHTPFLVWPMVSLFVLILVFLSVSGHREPDPENQA